MARKKKEDIIINEKPSGWVDGAMPLPEAADYLPAAPDPSSKVIIKEEDQELPFPEVKSEKPKKASKANSDCYPIPDYKGSSLLDALRSIGVDSSYGSRKEIAKANGIENYLGLGKDNKEMLDLLMAGKLKRL